MTGTHTFVRSLSSDDAAPGGAVRTADGLVGTLSARAPTVSVVVPCYKQAHFLHEAVGSVRLQTRTDWELIVVDDGSPDETHAVALELQAGDPRVRVIHKENAGLAAARNTGIAESRGRYILPLDADDLIDPDFLAETVAALESHPEASIAYTDAFTFGVHQTLWPMGKPFTVEALRRDNVLNYCSLYRRELFDAVGGYNPNMVYGYEDWDFWLGAAERGARTMHVPRPLFYYRVKQGSMITTAQQHDAQLRAQIVLNHAGAYDEATVAAARELIRRKPMSRGAPVSGAPVPGATLANVDAIWSGSAPVHRPLHVAYLVPHHNVTGGLKILVEHLARLTARGHRIRAVYRGRSESAIPSWAHVRVSEDVVLPPGTPLAAGVQGADVVLAGWFADLPELAAAGTPVLHFEQGHELLYGDVQDHDVARAYAAAYQQIMTTLPIPCAAVSPFAAEVIRQRFGRQCGVVPNGIDAARFTPGVRSGGHRALLVSNAALPFKGAEVALRALARVHAEVPDLRVTWITQVAPNVAGVPFPLELIVNPPQDALPALYQEHDVFVTASWYESYPLPPLEAMASGVPVVSTDSGGIRSYGRPGENCLLVRTGDDEALSRGCVAVLRDQALAHRLSVEGRRTAETCTWDAALDRLDDALVRVAGLGRNARAA